MDFWPPPAALLVLPFDGGGPPAPLNPGLVFFLLLGLVFATVIVLGSLE